MALAARAMAAPAPGLWPSAVTTPSVQTQSLTTVSVSLDCPASTQYITVTGSPSACTPAVASASGAIQYVTVTVTEVEYSASIDVYHKTNVRVERCMLGH